MRNVVILSGAEKAAQAPPLHEAVKGVRFSESLPCFRDCARGRRPVAGGSEGFIAPYPE